MRIGINIIMAMEMVMYGGSRHGDMNDEYIARAILIVIFIYTITAAIQHNIMDEPTEESLLEEVQRLREANAIQAQMLAEIDDATNEYTGYLPVNYSHQIQLIIKRRKDVK